VKGALLVAGTSSDAGKSMIAAGLCRWLARQGVPVAPVKAQNMSLNSFVITDGAQIGRAQAMQAAAAGIEPQARMNPVLLKTGSDWRSRWCCRPGSRCLRLTSHTPGSGGTRLSSAIRPTPQAHTRWRDHAN